LADACLGVTGIDPPPRRVSYLRTDRWSFVEGTRQRATLFDMLHDPDQEYNLADNPASAATVRDLRSQLRRFINK
jgi:hypothetical protein